MVNYARVALIIALLAPNTMEFVQLAPPPSQFRAAPIPVAVRLALFTIRLRINALLRPIAQQVILYNKITLVHLVVKTALAVKNTQVNVLPAFQITPLIGKMIRIASSLPVIKLDQSVTKLFAWKQHSMQHASFHPSTLMPQALTGEPFLLFGEFKTKNIVVAATHSVQLRVTSQLGPSRPVTFTNCQSNT